MRIDTVAESSTCCIASCVLDVCPAPELLLVLQLELVQDNLKYFLEIMQNNKSVLLEWLIIGLISAEIALGVFEITTRV